MSRKNYKKELSDLSKIQVEVKRKVKRCGNCKECRISKTCRFNNNKDNE